MSGILDYLDSNWSQLLGISPAQAATGSVDPAVARSLAGQANGQLQGGGFTGATPVQTTSIGPGGGGDASLGAPYATPPAPTGAPPAPPPDQDIPGMTFAQRAAPIQADIASGIADPQGSNYTDFSPSPNMPQPPNPGAAPPISQPPMPPPRPPGGPVMTADASGSVPIGPMGATPAGPPPPTAMGGTPTTNTAGGLNSVMGLSPNTWQQMAAGLGKGLSAVGAQRPGAFGAQSFAAGAGGAITGANQQAEQQQAQARQAKNDLFNQQSSFFKDYLSADAQDDRRQYQQAQIQFLTARAKATALGKGSAAWQNTPEGRVAVAEGRVLQFQDQGRKSIDNDVRNGVITPDQAQQRKDDLDTKTEQYRQNLYKGMGINPKDAENIKTMGTQTNPFDASKMTQDDFDTRVQMGGWYKDENGDVRQRVQPPAGYNTPATAPPPTAGVSAYGMPIDEQMALTPAA